MDSTELDPALPIRRCICFQRTFLEMKELALENGWSTVDEVRMGTGCGSNCGLCRPYIARMLKTGEVAFGLPDNAKANEA